MSSRNFWARAIAIGSRSMVAEVMAVVGMANETNRLASGFQVEIDEQFKT
jgi:hypothetical protein